ncbi:MAG TPA: type I-E CRISPR-associated protein Cas6/Cse3/CasE [Firmicutes bacterium]|nr:type I-E CRISPR-associated protein Cas6/Cse3/CasE [Bacillota bacterium]
MYLSRVKIDGSNRQKTKDLDHLGAYHNWVEESYPNEVEVGERSRKLWRIDHLGGDSYLLVLSRGKPDLGRLERYGVKGSAETKDYNVLLNKLGTGDRLRFRLVLNPVVSLSQGKTSGKRGRVIPLVTADQQLQFLEQRSLQHGFSVKKDEVIIASRSFEILKRRNQKPLKICKVAYEGLLTIGDLELFKAALMNGLGKKKAYGFGLLTVIPGNVQ